MRSRGYFRVVVLLAAFAGAFSGYEFWRAHRFAIDLAEGAKALASRHSRLQSLQRQANAASRRPEAVASTAPVAPDAAAPGFSPPPIPAELRPKRELSRAARMAWGRRLMVEHPEIRKLAVEIQQAVFEHSYRNFFEARGFTDDQIAALAKRITEETGSDGLWSDYGNFFLPFTDLSEEQSEKRREAILREALGDVGAAEFEQFSRNEWSHYQVQRIAGELFDTPSALTKSQAEQLEAILVAGRKADETTPFPSWSGWETIAAKAKKILAPQQFGALERQYRLETVGRVE
jgi:hypothetical protein